MQKVRQSQSQVGFFFFFFVVWRRKIVTNLRLYFKILSFWLYVSQHILVNRKFVFCFFLFSSFVVKSQCYLFIVKEFFESFNLTKFSIMTIKFSSKVVQVASVSKLFPRRFCRLQKSQSRSCEGSADCRSPKVVSTKILQVFRSYKSSYYL